MLTPDEANAMDFLYDFLKTDDVRHANLLRIESNGDEIRDMTDPNGDEFPELRHVLRSPSRMH